MILNWGTILMSCTSTPLRFLIRHTLNIFDTFLAICMHASCIKIWNVTTTLIPCILFCCWHTPFVIALTPALYQNLPNIWLEFSMSLLPCNRSHFSRSAGFELTEPFLTDSVYNALAFIYCLSGVVFKC